MMVSKSENIAMMSESEYKKMIQDEKNVEYLAMLDTSCEAERGSRGKEYRGGKHTNK